MEPERDGKREERPQALALSQGTTARWREISGVLCVLSRAVWAHTRPQPLANQSDAQEAAEGARGGMERTVPRALA